MTWYPMVKKYIIYVFYILHYSDMVKKQKATARRDAVNRKNATAQKARAITQAQKSATRKNLIDALQKKRIITARDLTPAQFVNIDGVNLTRRRKKQKLVYYKVARDYFKNASAPAVNNTKTRVNNTNVATAQYIKNALYNKNLTRAQKRDAVAYFTTQRRKQLDIDGVNIDGVYFKNNAKKLNYIQNNLTRDAKKQYARDIATAQYKKRVNKRKNALLDKITINA